MHVPSCPKPSFSDLQPNPSACQMTAGDTDDRRRFCSQYILPPSHTKNLGKADRHMSEVTMGICNPPTYPAHKTKTRTDKPNCPAQAFASRLGHCPFGRQLPHVVWIDDRDANFAGAKIQQRQFVTPKQFPPTNLVSIGWLPGWARAVHC